MTEFEWDKANIDHIAEHRITPDEAEQVILNNPYDLSMQSRVAKSEYFKPAKRMPAEFWPSLRCGAVSSFRP